MVGSAQLLADVLGRCRWGLEQDLGYHWTLSGPQPGRFSLHLLTDPGDDDAPGLLFAREHGGPRGVILAGAIRADRAVALAAAVLDAAGSGDLGALHRLL